MIVLDATASSFADTIRPIRARAAQDARLLLRLARLATRDGSGYGAARARRAREAASAVIAHARQMTFLLSPAREGDPPRAT